MGKLSNIAVAIDLEHDHNRLIEIGLTTINLSKLTILNTYSLPISVDFRISDDIYSLTGWTTGKLNRQGTTLLEARRRLLELYGCNNRLLVVDSSDEIPFLGYCLGCALSNNRQDVSILFNLITGLPTNTSLDSMLKEYGLTFQGKPHRADSDSLNIAKLFIQMLTSTRGINNVQI